MAVSLTGQSQSKACAQQGGAWRMLRRYLEALTFNG
jgi:hypothetical protein